MTIFKWPAFVDFIERVGATAFEAGSAVYIVSPSPIVLKAAGTAAAIAALKYTAKAIGAWQAKQPPPPPAAPAQAA